MYAVLVKKELWKVTNPMLEDRETETNNSKEDSALIILALGGDHMVHVEDSTTVRNAWDRLKNV